MLITDPVGDFIIRLKNAGAVGKETVSVPFSQFKLAIAEKLKEAGYVSDIEKKGKKVRKTLDVVLKYKADGSHAITDVKRISKPGRRLYKGSKEINPVRYGHGALILSTPQGVMTDKEARKAKVGGEALFEIW
jgi:small subunit ribosomal protein S8